MPIVQDLPLEFDPVFYKSRYEDLAHLSSDQLETHWRIYGRSEGRQGNRLVNRTDFVNLIPDGSSILEIGPFNAPLRTGPEVSYFDVLDRQGLIARAQTIGFDTARIPEVHYVSSEGDLQIIRKKFEFVISSHVLEHQPNPVKHLNDVTELLSNGGIYFLLIPDRRYCFDHYLPASNIAQLIEAYLMRNTRHCIGHVIEHRALTTHNDSARHWQGDHGEQYSSLKERCAAAIAEYERADGRYIDVHGWYFTPETFRAILVGLKLSGYISLDVIRVYATLSGANEFWAALQKI